MKNKIVAGLIVVTAVLFVTALFREPTDLESLVTNTKIGGLGIITGLSAVMTRFLIKEKN